MTRERWQFLGRLLLFSLGLGWLWFAWLQEQYPIILRPMAEPLLAIVGVRRWLLELTLHHFTNLIPYWALVLATPGHRFAWRRGVAALVAGTLVLIAMHLVMSAVLYFIWEAHGLGKTTYRFAVPLYVVNDSLPIVLWIGFYYQTLQRLFPFASFSVRGQK